MSQLEYTIVDLEMEECTLTLPADPAGMNPGARQLKMQLPRIEVSCPVDVRSGKIDDVATRGIFRCQGLAIHSSFPWTLSLANFSVCSRGIDGIEKAILQPLSIKCTVALNPAAPAPSSKDQVSRIFSFSAKNDLKKKNCSENSTVKGSVFRGSNAH